MFNQFNRGLERSKPVGLLLPWIGLALGVSVLANLYIQATQAPVTDQYIRFWAALLFFYLPAFWRLFSLRAARMERILLLVAASFFSYLPKLFSCPGNFCLPDEMAWRRSVETLFTGGKILGANPLGQIQGAYPGLPVLVTMLQQASGLSIYQTGITLIAILSALSLVAVFLLAERIFLSPRAAAAAALVYLASPAFLNLSFEFSGASLAAPLLPTTLLAVHYSAEANHKLDRPAWGVVALGLILAVVMADPGAALLLSVTLLLMAAAARWLPHLSGLSAPRPIDRFALFALLASITWMVAFTPETIPNLLLAFKINALPSFPPQLEISHAFLLIFPLLALLLSVAGLRLIFRLGLPVLAASFGIFINAAFLVFGLPALAAGANQQLPPFYWMLSSLGLSMLSGLTLAWWSSPKWHREPPRKIAIRQLDAVVIVIFLLLGSLAFAEPLQGRFPFTDQAGLPRALRPEAMAAARWMLQQTGPDNRLIGDQEIERVFSAYGLQQPASGPEATPPAAISSPTWDSNALLSLIKSEANYFVIDQFAAPLPISTIPVTGTTYTPSPSLHATDKYDQLPFFARIYDSGSIQIYYIPKNNNALVGYPAATPASTAPFPETVPVSGFLPLRAVLAFLLFLLAPGYFSASILFASWEKIDLATRLLVAIALSAGIDIISGLLVDLSPLETGLTGTLILAAVLIGILLSLLRTILPWFKKGFLLAAGSPANMGLGATLFAMMLVSTASFQAAQVIKAIRPAAEPSTVFSLDMSAPMNVVITNYERKTLSYFIVTREPDLTSWQSSPTRLNPGQKFEIDLSSHIRTLPDKGLLYIDLFIVGDKYPYRSLHIPYSEAKLQAPLQFSLPR